MKPSEITPEKKSVAQLELEVRDDALKDLAFYRLSEFIADPTISEVEKNLTLMSMARQMITEYIETDEFKKESEEKVRIQTSILEALKFDGCTVGSYIVEEDRRSGSFLNFTCTPYEVIIDIEDCQSMQDVNARGYLVVRIYKIYPGDSDESETTDLLVNNCVRTIQDAEQVCRFLQNGQEEEALAIIRPYNDLFPK